MTETINTNRAKNHPPFIAFEVEGHGEKSKWTELAALWKNKKASTGFSGLDTGKNKRIVVLPNKHISPEKAIVFVPQNRYDEHIRISEELIRFTLEFGEKCGLPQKQIQAVKAFKTELQNYKSKKPKDTDVAPDLQYYPTPEKVIQIVLENLNIAEGSKILEPSCGSGHFMDALRSKGADVFGIEYDIQRANKCIAKGHHVLVANFLETRPDPTYDHVIMNPPFYGKHYAKHVRHAFKFLKRGGKLTSILPASARYEHGLLTGLWQDLPTDSFKESGASIATTILTMQK